MNKVNLPEKFALFAADWSPKVVSINVQSINVQTQQQTGYP